MKTNKKNVQRKPIITKKTNVFRCVLFIWQNYFLPIILIIIYV